MATIGDIKPGQYFTIQNAKTIWCLDDSDVAKQILSTYFDSHKRMACVNNKGVRRYFQKTIFANILDLAKPDNKIRSYVWIHKKSVFIANAIHISEARSCLRSQMVMDDMKFIDNEPDHIIDVNEPGPHIITP